MGLKFISCSLSSESQFTPQILCLNFLADESNIFIFIRKRFSYKRQNIPGGKKVLKFSGGGAKGNSVVGPPGMINVGPFSLLWQKQSHAETGVSLPTLPETWLSNKYLLSICSVPSLVLDSLYKWSGDIYNHPTI